MISDCINNPFNIRFNRKNVWYGQIGRKKGFCRFSSFDYGVRACVVLLRNYIRAGFSTIRKIITRFAPASDGNDTDAYISFVSQPSFNAYRIDPDKNITFGSDDFFIVMSRMALMESNCYIEPYYICSIACHFRILK